MEQNVSLKAKRFSACEETPTFYGTRSSLPRLQVPGTSPYPEPENTSIPPIQIPEDRCRCSFGYFPGVKL